MAAAEGFGDAFVVVGSHCLGFYVFEHMIARALDCRFLRSRLPILLK